MYNVVSLSGGRTSGYLADLMRQKDPNTKFIFMDTGAEHPATHQFIRDIVKHWGIDLVCLRVVINPELGAANSYRVIGLDEIGPDLTPWRDMLKKYGTPYVSGEFCTDRMKLGPFTKYCDDHYGRKNYQAWIGIRADEPARLWGGKLHTAMLKAGMHPMQTQEAYTQAACAMRFVSKEWAQIALSQDFDVPVALLESCVAKVESNVNKGLNYLSEISYVGKFEVLDWWRQQPFDLQIAEHLGNCVFCVKKSIQKIALAAKDEPELAAQFWELLTSDEVRKMPNRCGTDLVMYRQKTSLADVIQMFSCDSRDELAARMPSQRNQ